jgi:hypothetical protein
MNHLLVFKCCTPPGPCGGEATNHLGQPEHFTARAAIACLEELQFQKMQFLSALEPLRSHKDLFEFVLRETQP